MGIVIDGGSTNARASLENGRPDMLGQQAAPGVSPLDVRLQRLQLSYRWARAVAVIAVIAVIGLAGWTALNQLNQPKGEQAVTDLAAAWTSHDAALLEEVYAPDAVVVSSGGVTTTGLEAIKRLNSTLAAYEFKAEIIGPVVQSGSTVVAPFRLTWSTGEVAWVTGIFELDSQGRVVHHQDYGTP